MLGSRLAPRGVGTGCGFKNRARKGRVDAFAAEGWVEISGNREDRIPDLLGGESAKVKLPKEIVERIEVRQTRSAILQTRVEVRSTRRGPLIQEKNYLHRVLVERRG